MGPSTIDCDVVGPAHIAGVPRFINVRTVDSKACPEYNIDSFRTMLQSTILGPGSMAPDLTVLAPKTCPMEAPGRPGVGVGPERHK